MRQPSLWAWPNWCCRLGAQLADKNGNVVFAFVFWVGSDLLFSYLCKSSSPFEEDPNPWLGEERETPRGEAGEGLGRARRPESLRGFGTLFETIFLRSGPGNLDVYFGRKKKFKAV